MSEFTEDKGVAEARFAAQEQMIRERAKNDAVTAMESERARRKTDQDMEASRSELTRTMNRAAAEAAVAQGRKEAEGSANSEVDMAIVDARTKQQEEMVRARARQEADDAMNEERVRIQSEKEMEAAKAELLRNFNRAAADKAVAEAMTELTTNTAALDLDIVNTKSSAQEELLRKQAQKLANASMEAERKRQVDLNNGADEASAIERAEAVKTVTKAVGEEQKRRTSLTPTKPVE